MVKLRIALALSFLLALSACGGGGGDSSSGTTPTPDSVTPPTLDLRAAWNNLLTTTSTNNFTISGGSNGFTLDGQGTVLLTNESPATVLVFNPQNPFLGPTVTLTNLIKFTTTKSGTLIQSGTSTALLAASALYGTSTAISETSELYTDTNGVYKVINDLNNNEQTLITSFTQLPTAVTAGSGGTFYNGTIYSRLGYTCGTASSSFTVASESNTSLLVTFTNSVNTTQQAVGQCSTKTVTSEVVYRLNVEDIVIVRITQSGSDSQYYPMINSFFK